jgi:hypothetical protein
MLSQACRSGFAVAPIVDDFLHTQVIALKARELPTRLKVVRDRVAVWPIVRLAFLLHSGRTL